jgi:hypothetical protein
VCRQTPARKLELLCDLYQEGIALRVAGLRRQYPDGPREQLEIETVGVRILQCSIEEPLRHSWPRATRGRACWVPERTPALGIPYHNAGHGADPGGDFATVQTLPTDSSVVFLRTLRTDHASGRRSSSA